MSEETEDLAGLFRSAHSGTGTPWLSAEAADRLVGYALALGEGVSMMEAAAYVLSEPVRESDWEILGADAPGENWNDHRDPVRAQALFRRKLRQAALAGARLQYRLWFAPGR